MTRSQIDQIQALDRVMYLLEEHSFQYLKSDSDAFAAFIEKLYAEVSHEAVRLETDIH